jgi:dipicolinate synthase subunit A
MNQIIGIIGGDLRQKYAINAFNSPVSYFANDKITKSLAHTKYNSLEDFMASNDIIMTPIPFTKDQINIYAKYSLLQISVDAFLDNIRKDQLIIGGPFSVKTKSMIREKDADYVDITTIELFKEKNAIPTCEGVLSKIIISSEITLYGSQTLILGYGQCGKRLAKCLKCLGSHICIYTENNAEIEQLVSDHFSYTADVTSLDKYNYIINTIPKEILNEENIKDKSLMIDITDAYHYNLNNFFKMRGIPGHYSPISAGLFIGDVTNQIIEKIKGENIG